MVAIVIVHYQNLADTLRCVESIRGQDSGDYRIVIVDSASPNNSGVELRDTLKDCQVILSPENNGFAASCNIGIRAADGADYIWLLNPDTTVDRGALSALIAAAQANNKVTAFGSKVLYGDRPKVIWSAGACVNLKAQDLRMIGNNEEDKHQYFSNTDCDYLPGCSIFAKKEVFNDLLPEKYFMYFEETDWCFSRKLEGKKLMFVADSIVYHHTKDEKMQSLFNVYYYNRNQLFFWYKFSTLDKRIRLLCSVIVNKLPKVLYALYKSPNAEYRELFKAHLYANLDFLFGKFPRRY